MEELFTAFFTGEMPHWGVQRQLDRCESLLLPLIFKHVWLKADGNDLFYRMSVCKFKLCLAEVGKKAGYPP